MTLIDATEPNRAFDDALAMGLGPAMSLANTLKALADPLRLRMLSAISTDPRGESCVCDLNALSDVSQPTISHHLKVLRETGLVESDRRGTWVWYRVAPARKHAVTALLDAFAPATFADETDARAERAETLRHLDAKVTRLAKELADELDGVHRELVVGVVRESYASLVRSAKVTRHLIPLTEQFARQRLADLHRDRESSAPQVLFVCVANAGRSQLAAALVNKISGGGVVARSAGSTPASSVHPHVRSLIAEMGDEAKVEPFPKPLTDDAVRAADVVVTMGCGDVCPIIPGVRYEDWAVGDPALASLEGVAAITADIETRVHVLLDSMTSQVEGPRS